MHQLSTATLPGWYRVLATIVGIISIALAFVLLIFPGLALLTLVFLLAFAFLVIGIDRLAAGITGHPYGFAPGGLLPGMGGPPPSGSEPAASNPPPK
jgi:hypothetical protein